MSLLNNRGMLVICLIGIILLNACSDTVGALVFDAGSEQEISSPTELPVEETPVPSGTSTVEPSPTFTATSEPTNTTTLTPTAEMTLTPSSTPFTGFEESKINSHQFSGEMYMYIFQVSGVSQNYFARVHNIPYECAFDVKYPDLLICVGEYFEFSDEMVEIAFYFDEALDEIVYQQEYYSGPTTPPPAIISGDPTTWCPERGQDVKCETEYRSYKGEECIVQTCYDACGYYYSVHTCPRDVPLSEFTFLPPPDER